MCAKTTKINESFVCLNCNYNVPPVSKTCRNHCPQCLYSLHVDYKVPGDRNSNCKGLMEPVQVIQNKKGYMIIHKCIRCGYVNRNKVMQDDCWNKVIAVLGENFNINFV